MNKRIFDPYSSFVHQFDHFLFDKLPPKSIVDRLVGGQTSRFETTLCPEKLLYKGWNTPHQ